MFDIKNIYLKKEIADLKDLTMKERGADIKYLIDYTRIKYGEKGIDRVKDELRAANYELLKTESLYNMTWIDASIPTIYMLAMAKAFNWSEEDVREMGRNVVKIQQTIRFFLKFFASIRFSLNAGAEKWSGNYSEGRFEITDLDEKAKKGTARLYDFKKHPITCVYLEGILGAILRMATGSGSAKIEETKCMFRGDLYHEFKFNW